MNPQPLAALQPFIYIPANQLPLLSFRWQEWRELEPPTPGFGDRCSSQLSYTPKPLTTLGFGFAR